MSDPPTKITDSCTCRVSEPDEFGNRDLLESTDCPVHGEPCSECDQQPAYTGGRCVSCAAYDLGADL